LLLNLSIQTCPFQYCYQLSSGAGFRPSLQPSWSQLVFLFLFAVEELYSTWYKSGSLINVGSGSHCLRSFFFFYFFFFSLHYLRSFSPFHHIAWSVAA
jgi:hypothetical protein